MLFAAEGGGFFSSSASGYSKGLTLLLLGQKKEDRPMRVSPWNQYQLVDQETEPYLQLASGKKRPTCGCASFVCFGRTSAKLECPSPIKVDSTLNQEVLPGNPALDEDQAAKSYGGCVVVGDDKIVSLRSSLKKTPDCTPLASIGSRADGRKNHENETVCENSNDIACQKERRKVQWTDTVGGELFEIREFEMSEDELDDDFARGVGKTCSCRVM
ncbi:uncharacterized protein LOC127264516 [Andrographis paniculata]|uniref:uncharacterized protein LOC127264516 n=1 Tax=Andrographis paniculata TaxID=175694 RepID=UPI0021E9163A|nr:uncharacterized protein LOC127264516 [Andrographis paniculata]XP_051150041.1 uncharacterized protein LOC127264516 [Andrographis paniculata]